MNEEWLPLCDEEGNISGKELRSVCHNGKSMLLHPVVHLHVFNGDGALFLQKRAMHKDVQPGRWDTAVGGHVDPGESIEEALLRESSEELGLEGFGYELLRKYTWESDVERELVHSFKCTIASQPVIDTSEVDEGRFWTVNEIKKSIDKEIFTPNLQYELKEILRII
ncbi:MAG: NUDIX domain-containing protein [Marinilabiliaceae bacterium]|nr:NUDIX domain-containing protein [Marinilabiliaceae bacterium]